MERLCSEGKERPSPVTHLSYLLEKCILLSNRNKKCYVCHACLILSSTR